MANSLIQTEVVQPTRGWKPGLVPDMNSVGQHRSLMAGGALPQISSLSVSADASLVMTFTDPNGVVSTISVTGDGGSAANTATAIKNKINSDYRTFSSVFASVNSTTVTVTGRRAGESFTISFDANVTVTTSQAAAAAGAVYPGRFVVPLYESSVEVAGAARLPRAADCTAQVSTVTPVAANSKQYTVSIGIDANGDGVPLFYDATFFSDGSGTVAEIVAGLVTAINAKMPAATVLAAANGGTDAVLLTAEIPGVPFSVAVFDGNDGASLSVSTTTASFGPRFFGVAQQVMAMQNPLPNNEGTVQWDGGTVFPCFAGPIIVECDGASSGLTAGAPVFARQAVNGSLTKLGAARSDADSGNARPTGWICTSPPAAFTIGGEAVYLARVEPRVGLGL